MKTNEELDKWFEKLSYEDKCWAIYSLGNDIVSPNELAKHYSPEEMLEHEYGYDYGCAEDHYDDWYKDDIENKQMVYEAYQ